MKIKALTLAGPVVHVAAIAGGNVWAFPQPARPADHAMRADAQRSQEPHRRAGKLPLPR